ncbi:MAG: Rne/Rng family ribonuclease [bacterium]|nr:Rne/Rng family ribonuclease [bacterium]
MQNEIIINADAGETRVAILERSTFTELYIERDNERSVVGNVIKGRVSRVLPGMQAAFVDIGLEKAGFLYVGDYYPVLEKNKGSGDSEPNNGRRRRYGRGRQPPKIETVLREGQDVVVQIAKEPIGTKGARITSNISIPGRHLVLTPGAGRVGVSRRIDSDKERRRLREIVERLRVDDLGFIIRTAGHGVRESDLEADIKYLTSVWNKIKSKMEKGAAPSVLYGELDLPLKMIRDFANSETARIAIDSEPVYEELKSFVDEFVAAPKPKIIHYQQTRPIFDEYGLESKIHDNLERKVMLKSGGHLVFDQGEALTAIDVNTGRYTGKRDLEETILRTNLEAAREVVYQLRFRNIGGLIIIDLIDMESADHREKVYRALQEALRTDKARTNILKISELGLVEMTRKRTRENLLQTLCEPCSYCEGRGFVLSSSSVAFKVLREIRNDLPRFSSRRIAISVNPMVAEQLLRDSSSALSQLGEDLGREIEIRARPGLHQEQFEVIALDTGPPVDIALRWLDGSKDRDQEEDPEKEKKGRKRGRRGATVQDKAAAGETDEDEKSTDAEASGDAGEQKAEQAAEQAAESTSADEAAAAVAEEPVVEAAQAREDQASPAELEPVDAKAKPRKSPQGKAPASAQEPAEPAPASLAASATLAAAGDEKPDDKSDDKGDGAKASEEPDPIERDASEVLDGESESRILPASRQPEES